MDVQDVFQLQALNTSSPQTLSYHILSGSFRSFSLFLLAFSPSERSIFHLKTIPAFGPHQYLAANQHKTRIYATSWALPPSLSSWEVERSNPWTLMHLNSVPITATSSYITVPPPYRHVYSTGGPTGEVHRVNQVTGGLEEKIQQILFVPESELGSADKTRKALRYGSHGIEFTPSHDYAFVPVVGTQTIEMYRRDSRGYLVHLSSIKSPRGENANDGPRHVKIHPNGKVLYCVTEHSNHVDAYQISPTSLTHIESRSLIPKGAELPDDSKYHFRGDTLMLSQPGANTLHPRVLITTTRGSAPELRGWLSIFSLDEFGRFTDLSAEDTVERYQTPTSGGKANAIDLLAKDMSGLGVWILLTDDDEVTASASGTGAIRVLEWDGWGTGGVKVVAEWPSDADELQDSSAEKIQGASHAIWLD
ncbi:hypothetical protein HYPSUDRAFT_41660 [Hypholoma sublateritium FD-334 SS-4]|uniref:Muconate cycloisomerase 1 n=1 Tax=Hypholoma sublateritium (strain FD-334 SS-4) TaxID=945553 RepID=A0A0D2PPJ0_HYPSF|nr:hypothetical protein HYPSUDRAFT_41660 [Hypholoma sublateritium FD-334 SS-4]